MQNIGKSKLVFIEKGNFKFQKFVESEIQYQTCVQPLYGLRRQASRAFRGAGRRGHPDAGVGLEVEPGQRHSGAIRISHL